jgi:hypothetical protein
LREGVEAGAPGKMVNWSREAGMDGKFGSREAGTELWTGRDGNWDAGDILWTGNDASMDAGKDGWRAPGVIGEKEGRMKGKQEEIERAFMS